MKTQIIKSVVAISFLAVVLIVSANAQTHSQIAVNIPFDFYARNQRFAAGEYLIESLNPASNQSQIVFRSKDGKFKGVVAMLPRKVDTDRSNLSSVLSFNRYGTQYFLAEISNPPDNFAAVMPKSKAEINLARQFGTPTRESVALNKK